MAIKLVIVDDAPFIREVLKHMFAGAEFEIVGEASDGDEAIEVVKTARPDVVLMDIVMPRKSGIDAARAIMEYDPQMKVIACSTLDQEAVMMKAIEAGCFSYITKPFKRDEVLKSVRSAVAASGSGKG